MYGSEKAFSVAEQRVFVDANENWKQQLRKIDEGKMRKNNQSGKLGQTFL